MEQRIPFGDYVRESVVNKLTFKSNEKIEIATFNIKKAECNGLILERNYSESTNRTINDQSFRHQTTVIVMSIKEEEVTPKNFKLDETFFINLPKNDIVWFEAN